MRQGDPEPDDVPQRGATATGGVFDWTLSPTKWGVVGVLALLGCAGLAWSIIRAESAPVRVDAGASYPQRAYEASSGLRPTAPEHTAEAPAAPAALGFMGPVEPVEDRGSSADPQPVASVTSQLISPPPQSADRPQADNPPAATSLRININTASAEELQLLPGIGPARARAIVDDRAANGPFRSVDDLDRVQGIGAGIIANLREFAAVR